MYEPNGGLFDQPFLQTENSATDNNELTGQSSPTEQHVDVEPVKEMFHAEFTRLPPPQNDNLGLLHARHIQSEEQIQNPVGSGQIATGGEETSSVHLSQTKEQRDLMFTNSLNNDGCENEEVKSEESLERSQEVILTSAQVRLQHTREGMQVQTAPYTDQQQPSRFNTRPNTRGSQNSRGCKESPGWRSTKLIQIGTSNSS